MERRLAAILIADVVDYSRLMGEDEIRTLAALTELRQKLFEPVVNARGGKVIKRLGDGWIVEYPNISDATSSAIEIQEGLAGHEVIQLRIGIHIGDITFRDDDIFGDGINVAARLEAMAEPGEVLISDTAQQSLDDKSLENFSGGEQYELKNITRSVAIWRWPGSNEPVREKSSKRLPLPGKPSIAVLPFDNLSSDIEQGYFSDGITEDIITALSRFGWFFVIARNSTFVYKGKSIDIRQVGRELGVRYVLEGSVRKAGNRIRITAQLIEAESGNHIWANKYDRDLNDIFELQDEITLTIAATIEPELFASERQRTVRKPTSDLEAWELVLRSAEKISQNGQENLLAAADMCRQAIALDPNFCKAHGYLADSIQRLVYQGWSTDQSSDIALGTKHANIAISIDPGDYLAHSSLGWLLLLQNDHVAAMVELEKATNINPIDADVCIGLAAALMANDEFERTLEVTDQAIRRSPNDPANWALLAYKAAAYRRLGMTDQAIAAFQVSGRSPSAGVNVFLGLAASHMENGQSAEAKAAVARAREIQPQLSIAFIEKTLIANAPAPAARKMYLDSLRAAGVPEELTEGHACYLLGISAASSMIGNP